MSHQFWKRAVKIEKQGLVSSVIKSSDIHRMSQDQSIDSIGVRAAKNVLADMRGREASSEVVSPRNLHMSEGRDFLIHEMRSVERSRSKNI